MDWRHGPNFRFTVLKYSQVPRLVPIGPMVPDCTWEGEARAVDDETKKSEVERWLDTQDANSVLYISFGSLITISSEDQIRELALALEASPYPFLWVFRPPGLPQVNKILTDSAPPTGNECIPPGTHHKPHAHISKKKKVRATKCLLHWSYKMYSLP